MQRGPKITMGGSRLQAGIPQVPRRDVVDSARGLLLRGVVTATYVVDDPEHPAAEGSPEKSDEDQSPRGVACDVLCYSDMRNSRWLFLRAVPVSQDRAGMHSGRVWKPRAATMTVSGEDLALGDGSTEPADVDGDHVLVGFIDDNFQSPVILRALPHPSRDKGNEESDKGSRVQLVLADGDPDFVKHHGSFYGIDDNGDFVLDTTHANDGVLEDGAVEADPPTDGSGAQRYQLPLDAEDFVIQFMDMAADPPEAKVTLKFNKTRMELEWVDDGVKFTSDKTQYKVALGGETLLVQNKDGDTTLKLGDGAVAVAISDHLETLYADLKAEYDGHKHNNTATTTATIGPSAAPGAVTIVAVVPDGVAPDWDPSIESTKVTIPDG